MIKAMIDHNLISGFAVGARGSEQVLISHLLFADDTLVFCGASLDQVQALGDFLVCFELVSGLKVNLAKSVVVLVGVVDNVGALAKVLGCGISSLPLRYLGLPLGSQFKDKASWNGVVEKTTRSQGGLLSSKVRYLISLLISCLSFQFLPR
jgi:hypothetical protein